MAGKAGTKWHKRKLQSIFGDWVDKRADKILARADRVLNGKDDAQFIALIRAITPLLIDQPGTDDNALSVRIISEDA
jgi:hypothetical protein